MLDLSKHFDVVVSRHVVGSGIHWVCVNKAKVFGVTSDLVNLVNK